MATPQKEIFPPAGDWEKGLKQVICTHFGTHTHTLTHCTHTLNAHPLNSYAYLSKIYHTQTHYTHVLIYQLEGPALEVAAKEWLQYLRNYDEISEVFDRHSNDGSGYLDKTKLKAVSIFVCDI